MRKTHVLTRLLSFTKKHIGIIILSFITALISVVATLFIPVLIGRAIDGMVTGGVDFNFLSEQLLYILICIAVSSSFSFIMSYCNSIISYKTVKDLRLVAFKKLHTLPLKYIDQTAHGDIVSRLINDIDQISDGLLQGATQFFTATITIILTLVFMFTLNWWITLIVVFLTPLSFFVASFISKRTNAMFKKSSAIQGKLSGYASEMIVSSSLVKTYGIEKQAIDRFEQINGELLKYGTKAQFYSSLANPSTRFVNGLVFAFVGLFGAIGAINGVLTVGQISSFLAYANQYTKPFNEVAGVVAQLQSAFVSAARVFAIIDEPSEPEDMQNKELPQSSRYDISFNDVSFSYSKDRPLIKGFNLLADSGSKIAIVGPTGCGKTTLINLLMRFYDVDKGCISVNDSNIADVTRHSLRRNFGMVLQDTWIYKASVFDNISYGNPNATMEEVIAAAKEAYAHSFIKSLPDGYNTILSEDGSNISAGQKQLISIARVMVSNPRILILDEATSSIDISTERYVTKAFDKMMKGKTTFVVAHRLSTILSADLILVMDNGNVVEQGTHHELLAAKGFYYSIYNSNI